MRKLITLLLVATMLTALVGCNNAADDPTAAPTPVTSTPTASSSPSENTELDPFDIRLPLTDELTTFTMWGSTPQAGADLVDENDSYARQEIERLTNVHIEWTHPAIGQEVTSFNLLLASGSMTDGITATSAFYTGGFDKFIDDEIIRPLEDYGQYMPHYNYWRSQQENTLLSTITDAGHIAGIHQLRIPNQPSWQGPIIRADLFDEIGFNGAVEDIVTLEDWENVLTLFKNYSPDFVPLVLQDNNNGIFPFTLASFGLYGGGRTTGFYHLDNKVHYFPYEEPFKDYLVLMNDWYTKGLIDKDFSSRDAETTNAMLLSGKVGMGTTYKAFIDYLNLSTAGDNVHWEGLSSPLMARGQKFEACFALKSELHFQGQIMTITTDCKESLIPIIISYHDYLFSDEGSTLANYGVEGLSYEVVNGEIKLFDIVTKNEEGYSLNQQFNKYCLFQSNVFRYNWLRTENNISDQAKQIYTKWDKNYADTITEYPIMSVAQEDATRYSNIFSEIETYVLEFAMKSITGLVDPEAEWNTFVAQLERMEVAEMIKLQQEALNGFYGRDTDVGFPK